MENKLNPMVTSLAGDAGYTSEEIPVVAKEGQQGNINLDEHAVAYSQSEPAAVGTDMQGLVNHEGEMADCVEVPGEMLCRIFTHLDDEDVKSLLNIRGVCTDWKFSLDSSSELMRRLTFTVKDIPAFNESTVVSNAKSIRIPKDFKGDDADLVRLFGLIGPYVERIQFDDIDDPDEGGYYESRCTQIYSLILNYCSRLTHLSIGQLPNERTFLDQLTPNEAADFGSKLRTLVLDMDVGISAVTKIEKFLLSLSSLSNIVFLESFHSERTLVLVELLCKYMELVGHKGQLKGITMTTRVPGGDYNRTHWYKFFITCGKYNVEFKLYDQVLLNLQWLLQFLVTQNWELNYTNFQYFEEAELEFSKNVFIETEKIGLFKNINMLLLYFRRPVSVHETWFLRNLQKLQYLELNNWIMSIDHVDEAIGLLDEEILSCGYPKLENIQIDGNMFLQPSLVYSSFYKYFPNLRFISLSNLTNGPSNLIAYLSSVTNLEELEFDNCNNLRDQDFTEPCEPKYESVEDMVPAISSFHKLALLRLVGCKRLTDICITQGVACSPTLEKITTDGFAQDQFTYAGIAALKAVQFKDGEGAHGISFYRVLN